MIVVPFLPKHELDTVTNFTAYIQHIKENAIFFRGDNGVEWDDDRWDLTSFYPTTGNVKTKALFSVKPGGKSKPFVQPFMDQAKAISADFLRQNKNRQVSDLVGTLRRIYHALANAGKEINLNNLTDDELNSIEQTLSSQSSDPYKHCRLLERLVHEIIEPAKVTKSRLSWKSSQKYKGANRTDLVGERNRATSTKRNKLPDLRCILDLASVFNTSDYEPDIIVTSWFAISMYAPSRINEILTLSVNCERYDEGVEGAGHGIAWVPEKGGDPMVKRAASEESAKVAHIAIQRLIDIGSNARLAAKWYEDNPSRLFLPEGYEHFRGEPLTIKEISEIIGREKILRQARMFQMEINPTRLTTQDKNRTYGATHRRLYSFDDLETYVVNKLPFGWPYADQKTQLKYSDALFTVPFDIMRGYSSTCWNIPQFVTQNMIMHELGKKPTGKTIFNRNKLINPETGKSWKLASHQPRHLLNTIAQSKHLSQELIAYWSGRKSVGQNDYYDHTSHEFIIESFLRLEENAPKELIVTGPLNEKIDARSLNEPISRDEALKEELAAFHITEFGYCRHDFSLTPCPKDKWCNNCGEAYFSKGDARQIKRAKQDVAKFTESLKTANKAKADGEYGVEQWIEKLEIDLSRATLKLEKLTDPDVEDGTLISLPPPNVSQSKSGLSIAIRAAEK